MSQPLQRHDSSLGYGSTSLDLSSTRSHTPYSSSYPEQSGSQTSRSVSRYMHRSASSIRGGESHQIVCAVSEGRGVTPSVGVAFVNITTGEAVISQICDTQFYVKTLHKIQLFEPSRILIVSTACPPQPSSSLYLSLREQLPEIPVVPLDRKYWSETAGLEFIQMLAFREDVEAIKVAIEGNFYSVCSFAAAMKYLDLAHSVHIVNHTLRIRYQPSEETMMIDLSTIAALELIQNLHDVRSKDCLLGLLDETLTPMGRRMLRSNILQPSTQKNLLESRHEALDELSTKEDMFFQIRTALKQFFDVEKFLTELIILPNNENLAATRQLINQSLMAKKFALAVPALFEALVFARSGLLVRVRELCRPEVINPITRIIAQTINDDVTYAKEPLELRNQRTYAVKAGVNGLLDVARKTYKEATEDLYEYVQKFNAALEIAGDVRYDNQRKYWLRFRADDFEDRTIPEELINLVRKKVYLECQTLPLVKLNQRITDSESEVIMMSDKVIQELLSAIRGHIPQMFRVCESIALVDMLAAFTQTITTQDYARPDFTGTLALKSARHPLIDKRTGGKFVPNDVYATEQHRFQMITGCNMSGKSTYLRTVALLQVMAQIGCFVPARYAAFPIMHNLFSRLSTDDSVEANMSTFSVEMREMAFILRNINKKSLAIIDELGRGTSTRDGLAIAIAMAEALIQSNGICFFATHFLDMSKLLADRPGVLTLHLETETTEQEDGVPQMTMLYKVSSGPVIDDQYGIKLARAIGFPATVISVAERVSAALKKKEEARKHSSETERLRKRRKLVLQMHEMLKQADQSDMNDGALWSYLLNLRAQFVTRMDEIENMRNITSEADLASSQNDCDDASVDNDEAECSSSVTEYWSYARRVRRDGHGSSGWAQDDGNQEFKQGDQDAELT